MTPEVGPRRDRSIPAVALTALLVASVAVAGVNLAAVGTASAAPTGIDSCTTIDEPGTYALTANVSPDELGDRESCVSIRADDVTFDGNGHAVDISDVDTTRLAAVGANGSDRVENVTVRDVTALANGDGDGIVYRNVTDGVIANVTTGDGLDGYPISVSGGEGITVRDSALSGEYVGPQIDADDVTVVRNRMSVGAYGMSIDGNGIVFRNNTVVGGIGSMQTGGDAVDLSGANVVAADNHISATAGGLIVSGSNGTVRNNTLRGTHPYVELTGIDLSGSNYTVVGNDVTGNVFTGVVVGGSDNVVSDNDVAGGTETGIEVGGANNTVSDNPIGDATTGIVVLGSGTLVEGTVVTGSQVGVQVWGANTTITDVVLTNNRNGLRLMGVNNTASDVSTSNNDLGVEVGGSDNAVLDSTVSNWVEVGGSNNTVSDSTVSNGVEVGGSNNTVSGSAVSGFGSFSDRYAVSVAGSNNTVAGNDVSDSTYGVRVRGTDQTVRGNRIDTREAGIRIGSTDSLVYDNAITAAGEQPTVVADRTSGSNAWNVSARAGTNVVGGPTVGGNYYATTDGVGFSEACGDADADGLCDHPNALTPTDTDHLPLADDANASVAYFEVSTLDVRFDGGGAAVAANVTNVGTVGDTQTVTVRPSDETRSVTLAAGETETVTFDVAIDAPAHAFPVDLRVGSANSTLSTSVNVTDVREFYQVDFVAGQPIENLSADRLYAQEDRLRLFAFGTAEDGITETGSAWPGPRMRGCLAGSGISEGDDGTVEATFTVVEGCELTLSLAVYSMPGETFDASTADQQELLDATTGTFGPGEHTITVDVPTDEGDGDDGDD